LANGTDSGVKREGWGETEKGTDDGKKRKKWREKTKNGIDSEKKTGKSGYKRKENSWSHSPRLAAPSCWLAGCFSVTSAPLHMACNCGVIRKTGSI